MNWLTDITGCLVLCDGTRRVLHVKNLKPNSLCGESFFSEDPGPAALRHVSLQDHGLTPNKFPMIVEPPIYFLCNPYVTPAMQPYIAPMCGSQTMDSVLRAQRDPSKFPLVISQAKGGRMKMWGFPKIRGTLLGVPIIRTIAHWDLYWVPLFWETTM